MTTKIKRALIATGYYGRPATARAIIGDIEHYAPGLIETVTSKQLAAIITINQKARDAGKKQLLEEQEEERESA
jgi:hypothetical protein